MGTRCRAKLTVEEVCAVLDELTNNEEEVEAIYIEAPDAGALSGDDSADEDGGTLENLSHTQLVEDCEIVTRKNTDVEENPDFDMDAEILDCLNHSISELEVNLLEESFASVQASEKPSTSRSTQKPREQTNSRRRKITAGQSHSKAKRAKPSFTWVDDNIEPRSPIFPEGNYSDCTNLEPYEQFQKFFDDELLQMLCDESNRYSLLNNNGNPNITVGEMKVFLGILIISGYTYSPNKEAYWSVDKDIQNLVIIDSMRRDRFRTIFRNLHFIDPGKTDLSDKIWKLRPLTDALKANFAKNFHPERNLSYDESMVEYYGRHGCKQFIRGKPLRFGYKMWCLNTPSGYLLNFEMYQGKNPRTNEEYAANYGKNAAPLFSMIDEFDETWKPLPFQFFFDNLFTSIPVLVGFKKMGYEGTGTIRQNSIPISCPLPLKDKLKKKERGYMASSRISECDITVTKWVDNAVVSVASTLFGKEPVGTAGRYSRAEHARIQVQVPNAIVMYNKNMGGTDRMDQNVNAYRIGARGKKWWFSIFTWLVDVSIQNAWLLHRKGGHGLTQLQFRRTIANHFCRTYGQVRGPWGFRRPDSQIELDARYDLIGHFIVRNPTRRRCAGNNCQRSINTKCVKCDVGLCVDCFYNFHFRPV